MNREKCRCEYIVDCAFYRKFGSRQSNVWQAIFRLYCDGHSKNLCEVYARRQQTGRFTPPDIMPTGRPVSFVYKQLP